MAGDRRSGRSRAGPVRAPGVFAGRARVDVGLQHFFSIGTGLRQHAATGVDDRASPDETKPALVADPVDRQHIHCVFHGPRRDHVLGGAFRMRWPVRRQHEQIGTQQRQDARRLGKTAVIADVHANLQAARVVNRERPVAGVDEHVDAQKRQMHLAIAPDHSSADR